MKNICHKYIIADWRTYSRISCLSCLISLWNLCIGTLISDNNFKVIVWASPWHVILQPTLNSWQRGQNRWQTVSDVRPSPRHSSPNTLAKAARFLVLSLRVFASMSISRLPNIETGIDDLRVRSPSLVTNFPLPKINVRTRCRSSYPAELVSLPLALRPRPRRSYLRVMVVGGGAWQPAVRREGRSCTQMGPLTHLASVGSLADHVHEQCHRMSWKKSRVILLCWCYYAIV